MSFGIPTEALPISSDGEIKTNWQKKWMTARRKKEMNMELYGNNFGRIDFPTNKDVLLGKGRPIQKHPGNVYLRNLVHSHTASYFLADSKTAKSTFTWKIVDDIKNKGGRFLTKDKEDCWILALDNDARQKVGKLFMTSQAEYKRMAASTYPLGGNASDNNPRSSLIEQDAKRLRTCFDFYSS